MSVRLLPILLLIALAGCSAFGGSAPTTTATPAAVPNASEAALTSTLPPPGVTDGTVTDPDALLAAHERALSNTPYRFEKRVREQTDTPDGVRRVNRTVSASVFNTSAYHYDRRTYRSSPDSEMWENFSVYADGDTEYVRNEGPTGVRYWQIPVGPQRQLLGDIGRVLAAQLETGETSVVPVEMDGQPHFGLTVTSPNASSPTVQAFLSPSGRIDRLTATYNTSDGERIVYRGVVTTIDQPPEPPAWLPDAMARTNASAG